MPKSNKKSNKKIRAKRENKTKVKTNEEIQLDQDYKNNLKCIRLINQIRKNKKQDEINKAFEELLVILMPKIYKVVSKFNIPGCEHADVLQEALFALRYKAIKDYDKERGTGDGPAPFDKFALLCIRRHLATEFKSSYQIKRRVLNNALSIYKDSINNNSEEDVTLSSIISDPDALDVSESAAESEYYKDLQILLLKSLSGFEKEVYLLYAQKYSYEEIADKINSKRLKVRVNVKGVDNALSRIKNKAREILDKYENKNSSSLLSKKDSEDFSEE